ncbi:MAG: SPFH domain-containing protein [Lachnospiraceae bacterium]|nr:SPFH domain-containing protein [Lachnospiraceae bacterium]
MSDTNSKSVYLNVEEKEIVPLNGILMLFAIIGMLILSVGAMVGSGFLIEGGRIALGVIGLILSIVWFIVCCICFGGFHVINPNEALVMTLFGQYYGTIRKPGFYFTNPFAGGYNPTVLGQGVSVQMTTNGTQVGTAPTFSKKVSTKVSTLNNEKQKVNDALGNPIIIGTVVIWRVASPTKAVFNVDNYKKFLSIQCDSTVRNVARLYPYDTMEDDTDELTLRGSSMAIAESMKEELQKRVAEAGLEIQEVRINHLAYSDEIASAMLQRQQAVAIIAARQKIVEGAVSMVKMAIDQLGEEEIVVLDEERKAAMVSNLLVVLCGNKDAQPIVNSGSIY